MNPIQKHSKTHKSDPAQNQAKKYLKQMDNESFDLTNQSSSQIKFQQISTSINNLKQEIKEGLAQESAERKKQYSQLKQEIKEGLAQESAERKKQYSQLQGSIQMLTMLVLEGMSRESRLAIQEKMNQVIKVEKKDIKANQVFPKQREYSRNLQYQNQSQNFSSAENSSNNSLIQQKDRLNDASENFNADNKVADNLSNHNHDIEKISDNVSISSQDIQSVISFSLATNKTNEQFKKVQEQN